MTPQAARKAGMIPGVLLSLLACIASRPGLAQTARPGSVISERRFHTCVVETNESLLRAIAFKEWVKSWAPAESGRDLDSGAENEAEADLADLKQLPAAEQRRFRELLIVLCTEAVPGMRGKLSKISLSAWLRRQLDAIGVPRAFTPMHPEPFVAVAVRALGGQVTGTVDTAPLLLTTWVRSVLDWLGDEAAVRELAPGFSASDRDGYRRVLSRRFATVRPFDLRDYASPESQAIVWSNSELAIDLGSLNLAGWITKLSHEVFHQHPRAGELRSVHRELAPDELAYLGLEEEFRAEWLSQRLQAWLRGRALAEPNVSLVNAYTAHLARFAPDAPNSATAKAYANYRQSFLAQSPSDQLRQVQAIVSWQAAEE